MPLDLKALVQAVQATDKIVTRPVQEWLIKNGDQAYPAWVADKIRSLLIAQPRIRMATFSASSAGKCERAQLLAFLGARGGVTDAQLQNIFNDGKWRHLRWQAMLLTMGVLVDIEYPLLWLRYKGVGTMDGLGIVPEDHPNVHWRGEEFGFELKGVSTFQFSKYKQAGPKEDHLNQVHRYFAMSGLKLFVILYEDKTTQAFTEWVVTPDPVRLREQTEELERLWGHAESRRLPPMLDGCAKGNGPEWRDCQFAGRNGTCVLARMWPTKQTPGFEGASTKQLQP